MNKFVPAKELAFPLQAAAFRAANEIIRGSETAGFVFHVETIGGRVYSGPPASHLPIEVQENGVLELECGDGPAFIYDRAIAAIRVEEV